MRLYCSAVPILALTLLAFPAPARSTPGWRFGVGGSLATSYAYQTIHFGPGALIPTSDLHMSNTFMGTICAGRRLGSLLWIQTSIDYFDQQDRGNSLRSQIACWAVGVRAASNPADRGHLYLEMLPALYGGKWTDEIQEYSLSSLRPGWVGGVGVVGDVSDRIHFDFGVRWHASSDWPVLDSYGPDEYHGVQRMSLGVRFLYGI